jgi:hypothetical protein
VGRGGEVNEGAGSIPILLYRPPPKSLDGWAIWAWDGLPLSLAKVYLAPTKAIFSFNFVSYIGYYTFLFWGITMKN